MCVIIITGIEIHNQDRSGIGLFAEPEGNTYDKDFVKNNTGKEKIYPGGPTCTYKNKRVPCLVRCLKEGCVNGHILRDIFEALDNLDLFDRSGGKTLCAIIDGYQSRFTVVFLKYMHAISH